MPSLASIDDANSSGLPRLRHALIGAFARPGGSIDLPLRDLAVLLLAVQRPGLDLGALTEQTGLARDVVRHAVDCLRRAGLLTNQAGAGDAAMALVPTASGEKVVRDMVRGMSDAAPQERPEPLRATGGADGDRTLGRRAG